MRPDTICIWDNPEAIEHLKRAWVHTENSASNIADALNREFSANLSRNAVISKAHRLGLPGRPSPIKRGGARARRSIQQKTRREFLGTEHLRGDGHAFVAFFDGPIAPAKRCQFIAGEPSLDDSCKCPKVTIPSSSYCAEHHAWCHDVSLVPASLKVAA